MVAGIGQVPVGEHWQLSLRNLAAQAMLAAIRDAGGLQPKAIYIGNYLASVASEQANLGALLAESIGLPGVEGMTAEEATLRLVNLNPVHARRVIVQGGAYAEHRIESVACGQETREVGAPWFAVELAPGAGAQLRLSMSRYACPPTLAFPWG